MPETASTVAADPIKVTGKLTAAKVREIHEKLQEPFPVELIKFLPTNTDWKNKTATALAYADTRAYTDRLNKVVGVDNWSQSLAISCTPAYQKTVKGRKVQNPDTQAWEESPSSVMEDAKVILAVTVTITGLGSKTNVGECEASDENAATTTFAKAFKRACADFGLGRYLYDIPKTVCKYDTYNKCFSEKDLPELPDWAIPHKFCTDCHANITPLKIGAEMYSVDVIVERSTKTHGRQLCGKCSQKAAKDAKDRAGKEIGVPQATVAA
jgi:hypothetical protein